VDSHQRAVVNRLKTARGSSMDLVRVESDAYCPEVMKQLSAVQACLEGASRIMLAPAPGDLCRQGDAGGSHGEIVTS